MVEAIQLDEVREHGGLAGVRDEGLLESALARPRHRWTYKRRPDFASLSAAYAFGLARNHPFHDGNKRVAFVTAVVFLGLNGLDLEVGEIEVVEVMLRVAAGGMSEAELATWIRSRTKALPSNAV